MNYKTLIDVVIYPYLLRSRDFYNIMTSFYFLFIIKENNLNILYYKILQLKIFCKNSI